MNTRRRLLAVFGAATIARPLAVLGQSPGKVWRIGSIALSAKNDSKFQLEAATGALRSVGLVEGKNLTLDTVFAENDRSRLPEIATALVSRSPDLIIAFANPEALAIAAATKTIPIVFFAVSSPVELGLVQSFARPGGNITGIANIGWELAGKRLQLLKEVLPRMSRVGVLVEPASQLSLKELQLIESSAKDLGVRVVPANLAESDELEKAFEMLSRSRVDGLLTTVTVRFMNQRASIAKLGQKNRIPVVGHRGELANEGALMSYSANLADQIRRGAEIVDKILKGTKPAEIPVEQPTIFDLVINQRTARELGISIPPKILLQASRVID